MSFSLLRNKLIARGYWSEAVPAEGGADSGGSAGGDATATTTTTETGTQTPAGTLLGGAPDSTTQTTENQSDSSAADDQSGEGNGEASALTEYVDFTIPEGVHTNPEVMTAFKETALKAGLSQEQAQMMIEMGALQQQKILAEHFQAVEQQKAEWEAAARSDKEYGGDKFEESLAAAAKARDAFVTPALREQLDKTGLGNHPDLIRVFVRAGKLISEDSLVPGGSKPSSDKSAASTLYPNQA